MHQNVQKILELLSSDLVRDRLALPGLALFLHYKKLHRLTLDEMDEVAKYFGYKNGKKLWDHYGMMRDKERRLCNGESKRTKYNRTDKIELLLPFLNEEEKKEAESDIKKIRRYLY